MVCSLLAGDATLLEPAADALSYHDPISV